MKPVRPQLDPVEPALGTAECFEPKSKREVRQRTERRALLRAVLGLSIATPLSGCALVGPNYSLPADPTFKPEVSWDEEVLLSDGRMIVVRQWRSRQRLSGDGGVRILGTKASITFPALDGSKGEAVRYEGLIQPLILNVWAGRTYLVGQPLQHAFFVDMGAPRSGWIALVLNSQRGWDRISPRDVPERIRETNLLIAGAPPASMTRVMWATKISNELNANLKWPDHMRMLDPSKRSGWAWDWPESQLKRD